MPTKRDYRRAGGALLGPFKVIVNTAASADGSTITAAHPIKSSSSVVTALDGYFLRRSSTGETRMVKTPGGYDPTNGRIYPDAAFDTALAVGEEIEVQGIFDPDVVDDLVNQTLKLCYLTEEVAVPGVDQQGRYSLTAVAPWLVGPSWVRQASWLGPNETRDQYLDLYEVRRLPGTVTKIGRTIYWQGSYYSSDQTLYFLCVRRHYDYCRASGGVFGEQSGLDLDTDEADADADWVAAGTLMLAWAQYKRVLEQSTAAKQEKNQDDAAREFSSRTIDNFEMPPRTIRGRPRLWGPPQRGRFW